MDAVIAFLNDNLTWVLIFFLIAAGIAFYAFAAIVPLLGAVVLSYGLFAEPETVRSNVEHVFAAVPREAVEVLLSATYPDRFSPASLKSFAQNVSGTWTAAGYLHGKARKTRAVIHPNPESVTLLLFLAYLEGRTGQRLFSSDWMNLVGCSLDEVEALATSASHRGLMVFMNAGGVKEVRFPGYLTPEEEKIRQEVSHVV